MMGRLFDWLNNRPVETPRPGENILEFAARIVPEITVNDKFYVQNIGHTSPKISRKKWRLNVKGEVTRASFRYLCRVERAQAGENMGDDDLHRKPRGRRPDRKRLVGRDTACNAH